MKTIQQALIDDIHYPISVGFVENVMIKRGLVADDEFNFDIAHSNEYMGALADCLYSLIDSVNFSESDKSVSLPDRNILLKKVNAVYRFIGESDKCIGEPVVYIGG